MRRKKESRATGLPKKIKLDLLRRIKHDMELAGTWAGLCGLTTSALFYYCEVEANHLSWKQVGQIRHYANNPVKFMALVGIKPPAGLNPWEIHRTFWWACDAEGYRIRYQKIKDAIARVRKQS